MDPKTKALLAEWQATLSPQERELHALAKVLLKKSFNAEDATDNGSYFPEKSHAFVAWSKKRAAGAAPLAQAK
jgi:hypothetical protein